MRFEVLGPLRVVEGCDHAGEDEVGLRLGGARQQVVLAMLLASPNLVVSTDALIDGLWGDSPPSASRHTVQGYVSELRKLLGPVIEREGTGYVARLDRSSLDSLDFTALVSEGRALLVEHPDEAAETLKAGLRLWRGPPFSGLADADVLLPERTRLQELQLLALEDRVAADLASGRHREVSAELEALSREHPYREGLRALHMLALYRSGRQAEALRAFQQTRAVLVDELGIEPSPQLRQLEEQILVQDPALDVVSAAAESASDPSRPAGNPYVGLRAFTEADAANFYGRDELIAQLLAVVAGDAGFTAVLGPSGSGKSSLVRAGLIPAIRASDDPGSNWVIAVMRPGAYPFTELDAALAHAIDDAPAMSGSLLWGDDSQLLRTVLRVLPEDRSRLLLVIDQFEELFTLVDDEQRDRFLSSLVALATDPRGRSRVLVTLRADFYDRPLMHPAFGRMMAGHVVNVLPLAADELEAAAIGPALRAGVTFERGLLSEVIAEVSGQANALPLFQYTLTELFDRRQDSVLTRAAYEALGRIRGAVASRAEEIYQQLGAEQQEAAHQLFLRLVNVGRDSVTRRVVTASELVTLDVDVVTMHAAVEAFVASRLLVRDRDPFSGALTVEVAHEALLSEWARLRQWIDTGREGLRHHAAYLLVVDEWLTAGRAPDYLLTGGRLDQFEQWRATTAMRLTETEREFLDEALRWRAQAEAIEAARVAEQARLRRRARRRSFALGATVAAITSAGIVAIVTAGGTGDAVEIAMVSSSASQDQTGESYEQGLVRGERDFDLTVARRDFQGSPDGVITELAEDHLDLVILDPIASRRRARVDFDPDTHYVLTDDDDRAPVNLPNVTSLVWADEQGGFLAGVAAATTTRTGIVGFLGAFSGGRQEDTRAGFEAGAHSIDADIKILAAYMSDWGYGGAPYDSPEFAREVANKLYLFGADVIYHDVGASGDGVLQAASELNANDRWVIGSETDQWQSASDQQRQHVLTSILNHYGLPLYGVIEDYLDGNLESGPRRLTVADGMITYARSGIALGTDARTTLDRTIERLTSGAIQPPRTPTGEVIDRESLEAGTGIGSVAVANVPITFIVPAGWAAWGGGVFKGPPQDVASVVNGLPPQFGVTFSIVDNLYDDNCRLVLSDPPVGRTVNELAEAWANMPGFNATAATDVSVDGFPGKQVEFTVPDYSQDEDCETNAFGLWSQTDGSWFGGDIAASPNEHRLLKILDVNDTRLVISASYLPDASPQDRADLDEILTSIEFL